MGLCEVYNGGEKMNEALFEEFQNNEETKWAWLAGIIDSEGTISVYKVRIKTHCRRGFNWLPTIQISNNSKEFLETIQKVLGFGKVWFRKKHSTNKRNSYNFRFYGAKRVINFLDKLAPFLIIKKKHHELMREFASLIAEHRPFHTPHDEKLEQIYQRFREINRRG